MAQPFTVALEGGDAVGALAYAAGGPTSAEATVILAHGAGAPQTHPFMTSFARGLSTRGLDVITFNFLYMERKRRAPDPAARLEACYRAVIDTARQRMKLGSQRLVVGGKSMGGRIASQVVAAGGRRPAARPPTGSSCSAIHVHPSRPAGQTSGRTPSGHHRADALRPGQP